MRVLSLAAALASLALPSAAIASDGESANVARALGYIEAQLEDKESGEIIMQTPIGDKGVLCGWIFDFTPDRKMHEFKLFMYFIADKKVNFWKFRYESSLSASLYNNMIVQGCFNAGYIATPMPVGKYLKDYLGLK